MKNIEEMNAVSPENNSLNENELQKVAGGASSGTGPKYQKGEILLRKGLDNIRAIVIYVGGDAEPGYRWYQLNVEHYTSVHDDLHQPSLEPETRDRGNEMRWVHSEYVDMMELNIDRLYDRD